MSDAHVTAALPASLRHYPNLDSWIRFEEDESVTVFTGKVEIGQGIRTVIAQIAAEELDVELERVQVVLADTAQTPDEGTTAGSNSTESSGGAVRQAAAEVRALMLELAAEALDALADRLQVHDGTIVDPVHETQVSYWELRSGQPLEREATGAATPKSPAEYRLVGTSVPRLDIPDKVVGQPSFVDDMELPDMVHGRVVRPAGRGATLVSAGIEAVRQMPGVLCVVRDGSFLGVVARREEEAVRAADALAEGARWTGLQSMPAADELFDRLRHARGKSLLVVDGAPVDDPIPAITTPEQATTTVAAAYFRPFIMHASLGPSAALALMQTSGEGPQLTVWSHSQGVFSLRGALAQVLEMAEDDIRVVHVEGPGCYGHNGADDVALDAALLARAIPDRPVMLKWTRGDEFRWEPYGPAMALQLQASLDAEGRVLSWNHDVWSYTHSGRPRPQHGQSGLLAAQYLKEPLFPPEPQPGRGVHSGIHRNADPLYNFEQRRIVKHFVADSPVRTSSLRTLGAFANVFAIESFVDELAAAAGKDPVAFRLAYLDDARARHVLTAAAEAAQWERRDTRSGGQGIAFAQYKNQKCYVAVVAELDVDQTTGVIHLQRLVIAADAGRIINPDGLRNQLEGGAVQAASWTLKESVAFGSHGVTSVDWESYPILRFDESPEVDVVLLDQPHSPPLGAGEASQGPTAAAIANALYAAAGIRARWLPFTPERIRSLLKTPAG